MRSALLTTTSSGTDAAPISHRTVRTASICAWGSGAEPSTTWSEQVHPGHRLEGRAERLDQLVGELSDEPDGVGEQHRLAPGQRELAGARVQGDKEAIRGRHSGIGEPVEEGRLPGVRVADEGELAVPSPAPPTALDMAGPLDAAQILFEPVHATDEAPAVDFELGLARTPRADPAGLLGEGGPPPAQSRQAVAQEGELDLSLALGAARVLGEDVQDHRGAVDGRPTQDVLEVALLGGREVVVEDDRVHVQAP